MDGITVRVVAGTGRPRARANGIGRAIEHMHGYTVSYNNTTGIATYNLIPLTNDCHVTYNEDNGETIITITGC